MKARTSWLGYRTTMGTYHLGTEKKFPFIELYCTLTASLPFFCIGVIQSIMPQIIHSMGTEDPFRHTINSDWIHWMSSIPFLGAAVGGLVSALLLEYLGRRRTIMLLSTLYIPGWLLAGLALNVPMLFSGVALIGVASGIALTTVPIYIAECARPAKRGRLSLIPMMMAAAGAAILTPLGLRADWRHTTFTLAAICKAVSIISIWLPESPTWLILKGRETDAYDCLVKIRASGREHLARREVDEIRDSVEQAQQSVDKTKWLNVMRRQLLWWPTWLTLSLMVFQQFSGISGVIHYMDNILLDVQKVSNGTKLALTSEQSDIVKGVVQFVPFLLALGLIDWIGRRALLLTSLVLMIMCHGSLGTYFYSCREHIVKTMALSSWLPSASLYALLGSYALGLASIPYIIMSEVVAAKWRSNVAAMAIIVNSLSAFLVVHFFEYFRQSLFAGYVFWLFGVICVITCIVVIFAIPETKGESLAQIQRSFDDNAQYFTDVTGEEEMSTMGGINGLRDRRKMPTAELTFSRF